MKPGNPDILSHLNQQSHNGTIGKRIRIRQNTLADNIMDLIRNIVPNNIFSVLFELVYTREVFNKGNSLLAILISILDSNGLHDRGKRNST